jgi:hypothetical protein
MAEVKFIHFKLFIGLVDIQDYIDRSEVKPCIAAKLCELMSSSKMLGVGVYDMHKDDDVLMDLSNEKPQPDL